jgi:O-methyltransferase
MPKTPAQRYLDLMKAALTFSLWPEPPIPAESYDPARPAWKRAVYAVIRRLLQIWHVRLVQPRPVDPLEKEEGRIVGPSYAMTLIGLRRLENLQDCVETVLRDRVPGDLIETGVWRGGACIFMRAILAAHGVTDRRVFAADSFGGLPPPNTARWPADRGDIHHLAAFYAVPLEEVQDNFRKFDLLDDQVVFLKGWFKDTLPGAPIEQLAVLRLDGDMYGSTMEALEVLYPKLSPGGFCVIDDYALPNCRKAIDDYRAQHGIRSPLIRIDWTGHFWRKE